MNLANRKDSTLWIAAAAREAEELQKAQEFAGKLSNESIAVAVKTGTGGSCLVLHAAKFWKT